MLGLRIKETKEVYEGELTELTPVETENPVRLCSFIYLLRCSEARRCGGPLLLTPVPHPTLTEL